METQTMIEDKQILDAWYRYAAGADGFIGKALKTQRGKEFLTQEQQRAMLLIREGKYDQFWIRLQAMPLPRTDQFEADVQRIVESIASELGVEVAVNVGQLAELIQAGLEP
jgi:hypothetical protein